MENLSWKHDVPEQLKFTSHLFKINTVLGEVEGMEEGEDSTLDLKSKMCIVAFSWQEGKKQMFMWSGFKRIYREK